MAAPPPLIPTGQQTFRWIVPQFCQQGRLTTLVMGAEAASCLRDLRMITIEPPSVAVDSGVQSTEPWIDHMVLTRLARTNPSQTLYSESSGDVDRGLESP